MEFFVYIAGPISGESYEGATEWREYVSQQLAEFGITALSPMRCKPYLKNETKIGDEYNEYTMSSARGVTTRDVNDVRRSDALFVNFIGAKAPSLGTALEIGIAHALNIPIVIAMEEDNPNNHAMIRHMAGFIFPTIHQAIEATKMLLLP